MHLAAIHAQPVMQRLAVATHVATTVAKKNAVGGKYSKTKIVALNATNAVTTIATNATNAMIAVTREYYL